MPDELAADAFELINTIAEQYGLIDEGARGAMEAANAAFAELESGGGVTAAIAIIDEFQDNLEDTGGIAEEASRLAIDALQNFTDAEGTANALTKLDEIKQMADSIAGSYEIRFKISTGDGSPPPPPRPPSGGRPAPPTAKERANIGEHGGQLGPITKVGEAGFEYIIGDTVIPHDQSRVLERLGVFRTGGPLSSKSFQAGGSLHGGGQNLLPGTAGSASGFLEATRQQSEQFRGVARDLQTAFARQDLLLEDIRDAVRQLGSAGDMGRAVREGLQTADFQS